MDVGMILRAIKFYDEIYAGDLHQQEVIIITLSRIPPNIPRNLSTMLRQAITWTAWKENIYRSY